MQYELYFLILAAIATLASVQRTRSLAAIDVRLTELAVLLASAKKEVSALEETGSRLVAAAGH